MTELSRPHGHGILELKPPVSV